MQDGNYSCPPASFCRWMLRACPEALEFRPGLQQTSPRDPMTPPSIDQEWFERCVVDVLPDLFGAALRLTRNRADAEDLVAEAVARGLDAPRHLDRPDPIPRMAVPHSHERVLERPADRRPARRARIAGRRHATTHFRFSSSFTPQSCSGGETPEQEFLDKLLREDLERAVDALPEPFRVVLVLADMHGCAYQEIAETLKFRSAPCARGWPVRVRSFRKRCGGTRRNWDW